MFKRKLLTLIFVTSITFACFHLLACKSNAKTITSCKPKGTKSIKHAPVKKVNFIAKKLNNNKMLPNKSSKILWNRLCNNFQMDIPINQKMIQSYIKKYKKQPYHFKQLSIQATPYLYHVVNEIEKQNLPGELAVLPMIESAYIPNATSKVGASGIWQLGKATATRFGVKQDHWYDGRKDIQDSTIAALNYLKFLHKEFNNDWFLALAAYNAGEGKVKQAIKRNKRLNKPTTFWDLKLPSQTKQFVPKILAMCYMLKNHNEHGITLKPIYNKPFFTLLNTKSHMTLQTAARFAEVPFEDLKKLNSGYVKNTTHPSSPRKLFLPCYAVNKFKLNLAKSSKNSFNSTIVHKVKRGDSLGKLAKKYSSSISTIKLVNNLKSNTIVIGKQLIIPLKNIKPK